jgi:flagellar biogenesis protein FliO
MPPATSSGVTTVGSPLFLNVDPVLVGIIAVLLLIVFALYLFVRKTLLSFSEGIREGKRKR